MIMEKITVSVCLGTTCHLMGSSHLQTLEQDLPERFRERTSVKWSRCLGHCKEENHGRAPFVLVGDELVCEATVYKIVEKLETLLK